jgi:hypothetical protein
MKVNHIEAIHLAKQPFKHEEMVNELIPATAIQPERL